MEGSRRMIHGQNQPAADGSRLTMDLTDLGVWYEARHRKAAERHNKLGVDSFYLPIQVLPGAGGQFILAGISIPGGTTFHQVCDIYLVALEAVLGQ